LWGRKAGIAATVVAVMVAIGRVVLGEHWTMDVIVGLGLGATTGLAVFGIVGPALENAAPRTTVDSKA
jgi:membrane-associated phospholipid phosphatase